MGNLGNRGKSWIRLPTGMELTQPSLTEENTQMHHLSLPFRAATKRTGSMIVRKVRPPELLGNAVRKQPRPAATSHGRQAQSEQEKLASLNGIGIPNKTCHVPSRDY